MRKRAIAFILASLMLTTTLSGCGKKQQDDNTLEVWSFTEEVQRMIPYYEETHPDIKVNFTLIPTDVYPNKLKNAIQSGNAPDVFALEGAFIRNFVEEEGVMADLNELKPELEAIDTLEYTMDIGTDENGDLRAVSWQGAPGAMFYRRSLAKKYLGTDDPEKVQEYFSDLDKFLETSELLKEKSNGKCFTICSTDDLQYIYKSHREHGWVEDEKIIVDDMIIDFAEMAKKMYDNKYEAEQGAWAEGWFAGMSDQLKDVKGNPQEIFCYFFPAWGLSNTLMPNAKSADGKYDTSGGWGVIEGPASYYWGGSWLGVNEDSQNKELAIEMVEYFTTDEDFLVDWANETNDFLASEKIMREITQNASSDFLGGQNPYEVFLSDVSSINGKLLTSYDKEIDSIMNNEKANYSNGKISIEQFKENIEIKAKRIFPDLS